MRSSNISNSSSPNRPFYLPVSNQLTSADIIRESRDWLHTVETRRPSTPKSSSRSLFKCIGPTSTRPTTSSSTLSEAVYENIANLDYVETEKIPHLECEQKLDNHDGLQLSKLDTEIRSLSHVSNTMSTECTNNIQSSSQNILQSECSQHKELVLHGNHLGPPILAPLQLQTFSNTRFSKKAFSSSSILSTKTAKSKSQHSEKNPTTTMVTGMCEPSCLSSTPREPWSMLRTFEVLVGKLKGASQNSETSDSGRESNAEMFSEKVETNQSDLCNKIITVLTKLQAFISNGNFKNTDHNELLMEVSERIIQLSRFKNPKLKFAAVTISLMLDMKGKKLTYICKLIYKLAKDKRNDCMLQDSALINEWILRTLSELAKSITTKVNRFVSNGLLDEDYCDLLDSLLYLSGSLKFFVASTVTAKLFCSQKTAESLTSIHTTLLILSEDMEGQLDSTQKTISPEVAKEFNSCLDNLYHVLLQITEIFCVFSNQTVVDWQELVINSGVLETVIKALSYHAERNPKSSSEAEVCQQESKRQVFLNWSRLLAHVTEHASICRYLVEESGQLNENDTQFPIIFFPFLCQHLVRLVLTRSWELDFVVRLSYALGNLAARCDLARSLILNTRKVLKDLCHLCQRYLEKLRQTRLIEDDMETKLNASNLFLTANENHSTIKDVLVKLVRILANATISSEPGTLASIVPEYTCLLLDLLRFANTTDEELVQNCLAALNNLTFYMDLEERPELFSYQKSIGKACFRLLRKFNCQHGVILGVMRVLGNLTRCVDIRTCLLDGNADILTGNEQTHSDRPISSMKLTFVDLLTDCLNSEREDLVYSTLGVLVNLMADDDSRSLFNNQQGCQKLVEIVRVHAGVDWKLASLACMAISNFLDYSGNSSLESLGLDVEHELENLLSDFIDISVVESLHSNARHKFGSNFQINGCTIMEAGDVEGSLMEELWRSVWINEFLPVANYLLSQLRSV